MIRGQYSTGGDTQDSLTSDGVHQLVQDKPDERVLEAEALIKEARRRQIRWRWTIAVTLLFLTGALVGLLRAGPPGPGNTKTGSGTSPERDWWSVRS